MCISDYKLRSSINWIWTRRSKPSKEEEWNNALTIEYTTNSIVSNNDDDNDDKRDNNGNDDNNDDDSNNDDYKLPLRVLIE